MTPVKTKLAKLDEVATPVAVRQLSPVRTAPRPTRVLYEVATPVAVRQLSPVRTAPRPTRVRHSAARTTAGLRRPRVLFADQFHHCNVLDFLSVRDLSRFAMASTASRAACDGALRRVLHITYDVLGTTKDASTIVAAVVAVQRSTHALRALLLPSFPGDANRLLALAASCCGHLERLDLSAAYLSDATIVLAAEQLPALESVCFDRCHTLGDAAVTALAMGCKQLKRLSLDGCSRISDAALRSLGAHSFKLEVLILCGIQGITVAGMAALGAGCRRLRRMDLSAAGGVTFARLAPKLLGSLQALDLRYCALIDDEEVEALSACAPNLEWLSVQGCGVTDLGVTWLAESCSHITDLFLNRCTAITDVSITAVAKLRSLQRLGIEGCCLLTDTGLRAMAEQRTPLRTLGLNEVPLITDAGVATLAAACPDLEELFLNETAVSDAALAALGQRCGHLWHVSLNGCRKITPAGVELLAKGCPVLERLHLVQCGAPEDACSARPALRALCARASVAFTSEDSFGSGYATQAEDSEDAAEDEEEEDDMEMDSQESSTSNGEHFLGMPGFLEMDIEVDSP